MHLRSLAIVLSLLITICFAPSARSVHAGSSTEIPYPISASWPSGVRAFLRVETSPVVYNVLYRWGENIPDANGAYGPNRTAPPSSWYLEYQRMGGTDVIAGVLHRDTAMVAEGLKMFRFGIAREAPDGAFPGSIWPFHGTAMFLAESAPALIVLKYSPLAPFFRTQLAWQIGGMRRAAQHLVRVVHGVGKIDDPTKNHRFYEAALALGSTGVLTGDRTLIGWSTRYAWEAIHMEHRSGVMPEDGGHDTGYQGLGMIYASRYFDLVAAGRLRDALYAALARGERWELARVRASGAIDQRGDTRTVGCQERNPEGLCKTTSYATIFGALAGWGVISHNPRFVQAAYNVWLQNWRRIPGDVLPPPGLRIQTPVVRPGQWLTVSGSGFKPLETVRIYFGSTLVQTIRCDQTGQFGGHSSQPNAHFPVPAARPGTYQVSARGSEGTLQDSSVSVAG